MICSASLRVYPHAASWLKNPDAKDIKVEAVDAYGNTYVVDKFITQDNYPQDYSTLKLYE